MRLNLVSPTHLTDQHLIAEKRELRMIPALLQKKFSKKGIALKRDIPPVFVLGTGHMNFWLDKLKFLKDRFILIQDEMKHRNFFVDETKIIDTALAEMIGCCGDWSPRDQDVLVSKARIKQKLLVNYRAAKDSAA